MITNIEPTVCPICDGEQFVMVTEDAGHQQTGACPGCCCHYCGKTTTTPPECEGGCDVLEEAQAKRREDRP